MGLRMLLLCVLVGACGVFSCSVAQATITHTFIKRLPAPSEGGLEKPVAVAVGPDGPQASATEKDAVYVVDHDANMVVRFDHAGVALAFGCSTVECGKYLDANKIEGTPARGFATVEGVAVFDVSGEVFVSDGDGSVDVYRSSGEYVCEITGMCENPDEEAVEPACPGSKPVPFGHPAGLAVDQETEELYVADEATESPPIVKDVVAVFKLEPGGAEYRSQFGGGGTLTDNSGFGQTVAVAEKGEGLVEPGTAYVGNKNRSSERHVVDVFSALGTLEFEWRGEKTTAGSFGGNEVSAAVDPVSGQVLVADSGNRVVDEFAASAEEEPVGRLTGTPAGAFVALSAVAVDGNDRDVFVVDEGEGEGLGVADEFGPALELPEVLTQAASGVSDAGAVLHGQVGTGSGGAAVCWFAWGTSEALGEKTGCEQSPEGEHVPVSTMLSGLLPDTKYFYRLQAAYRSDEEAVNLGEEDTAECEGVLGEDGCFTTLGPGIESESVSDVASSSVSFDASIDPNDASTRYYFEYGSTVGYGFTAAGEAIGSAKGPVAVSQHVQRDLVAGSVYHYRAVAVSELEVAPGVVEPVTFYGEDHVFRTQPQGAFALIDARQWEMVSPAQKEGALIQGPGEPWGITMAAAGGDAMTYLTDVPTEKGVVGYSNAQQVLSTRGPEGGWSSRDLASPHNGTVTVSDEAGEEYRAFSENLTQAFVQPFGAFQPCHNSSGEPQACFSAYASEQTSFARDLETGVYTPIASGCPGEGKHCEAQVAENADVLEGTIFGQHGIKEGKPCSPEKFCGPFFDGASPDANHAVVYSRAQLTSEPAPVGGLYEWNAGQPRAEQLRLVSVLPDGKPDEAGVPELGGGVISSGFSDGEIAWRAVSGDGSRVFWRGSRQLYVRVNAGRPQSPVVGGVCTVSVDACTVAIGHGKAEVYQDASSTGSRVFFTEESSLGDSGLYECEVGGGLVCVPVLLASASGERVDVVGVSEDGSYVYYRAAHRLFVDHLEGGVWGARVVAGFGRTEGPSPEVSPDGRWLVFTSGEELTGYDNRDAASGERDVEVYLYDAVTGGLSCASCDPTGGRPVGVPAGEVGLTNKGNYEGWEPSTWLSGVVPGLVYMEGLTARYQPRFVSDSGRVFFDSDDALVSKDINGTWDVYEYEPEGVGGCSAAAVSGSVAYKPTRVFEAEGLSGEEAAGCVGLISSGESEYESLLLDASQSGGDVFFMTTAKLSATDFDDSYDVYDAHECTGVSPCPPPSAISLPPACVTTEACRAAPTPQPSIFGAPASATFSGVGNVTPPPLPASSSKKVLTRAERLAVALRACRRKKAGGRRVVCERAARRAYGAARKSSTARKSSAARRSSVAGGSGVGRGSGGVGG